MIDREDMGFYVKEYVIPFAVFPFLVVGVYVGLALVGLVISILIRTLFPVLGG